MAETSDDISRLRKDIQALQADVASLVNSLKEEGSERGRAALRRAKGVSHSLQSEARELQERAEGHVNEHPVTSLLTSFGLGFLVCMLLDRRH